MIPWYFDHCKPCLWIVQSDLDSSMTSTAEITKDSYIGHACRAINSLLIDYTITLEDAKEHLHFHFQEIGVDCSHVLRFRR